MRRRAATAAGLDAPPDPIAVGRSGRSSVTARILDRGYQRYEGPRHGRRAAIRSVATQTLQRSLGIRRSFWAKIFPIISVFIAYVPAIVFVGIAALFKDELEQQVPGGLDRILPTYGQYYGFVWAAIAVFVGFVAPEVLCTDRRNGLLGLYLASPLNRDTYLLAKAAAVGTALSLVSLGPPLVYLIGLTLDGRGPNGFDGFLDVLGRMVLAGAAVAALQVALSFAVSATTTRRAAASASIIMIYFALAVLPEVLVEVARLNEHLLLLNILFLPFELVFRIFGEGHVDRSWALLSTNVIVGAYFAWTLSLVAFVRYRYQRIQVTR